MAAIGGGRSRSEGRRWDGEVDVAVMYGFCIFVMNCLTSLEESGKVVVGLYLKSAKSGWSIRERIFELRKVSRRGSDM